MATIEERLASLEAKVVNPPTDYYMSQYSGEEIDARLGYAGDVPDIKSKVSYYSNKNLLDNWYFGKPVNQRGKTSYTNYGAKCTIDRWSVSSNDQTVTVGSDHITVTSLGVYQRFEQGLENYADFYGKTITVSALIKAPAGQVVSICLYDNKSTVWGRDAITATGNIQLISQTVTLPALSDQAALRFTIYPAMQSHSNALSCDVYACKMELGDVQTLAHEDGDAWVLNDIPDYGEELRKCQRYFQRKKTALYSALSYASDKQIAFSAHLGTPMRTSPDISNFQLSWIRGNGKSVSPTVASVDKYSVSEDSPSYSITFASAIGYGNLQVGEIFASFDLTAEL